MPIRFTCPKCNQRYKVAEDFAGRTAKCKKCGQSVKIPKPVAAAAAEPDLASLLGEEAVGVKSAAPAVKQASARKTATRKCAWCGAAMADGTVICVGCGFDVRTGRKVTAGPLEEEPESAAVTAARFTASLARGAVLSAIGAALGAAVWFGVAVTTGFQLGLIAWGLGGAAGAGMSIGHDDNDGTLAGVIAAGISLLGILGAKFAIFVYYQAIFIGRFEAVFIVLACITAYKVGSGKVTD